MLSARMTGWQRKRAYEKDFGVTFGITFVLTMIAAPFVTAGAQREEISEGLFVVFFLGALTIAVPTFFKAVLIAAVVFFPIYHLGAFLLGRPVAFVCGATAAAFLSASLALAVNVDFVPFNIVFIEDLWEYASLAGVVAAMIGTVVSIIQVFVGGTYA